MTSPASNSHMVSAHALRGFRPIDKEKTGDISNDATNIGSITNYDDISSLDARLNAIDSVVYSQDRLNSMTLNDKLFALKSNDDGDME